MTAPGHSPRGAARNSRRRRRTPESIGYRPPPIRVEIDPTGIDLPGTWSFRSPPRGELTLFDFGAVSLSVQYHVETTPAQLLVLAGQLAEPAAAIEAARRVLGPWLERIRPAIHDFAVSEMNEEYVVFQLGDKRGKWLDEHAGWIAGLLRLDSEPLSNDEVLEATRLRLAYTPHDLVVLDWAAGVVADSDCADTLQVIEYANVQLLEFRHIDDRLDDRLEAAYRLIRPDRRRRWQRPRWRLHGDAVRQIRELEIEATSLFERVDNSLKLIGDHYLARYSRWPARGFTFVAGNRVSAVSSRRSAMFMISWCTRRAASEWRPSRSRWFC